MALMCVPWEGGREGGWKVKGYASNSIMNAVTALIVILLQGSLTDW